EHGGPIVAEQHDLAADSIRLLSLSSLCRGVLDLLIGGGWPGPPCQLPRMTPPGRHGGYVCLRTYGSGAKQIDLTMPRAAARGHGLRVDRPPTRHCFHIPIFATLLQIALGIWSCDGS